MAGKGILFNTDMVRAILSGRKTVTRRPVKPQPDRFFEANESPVYLYGVEFNKGIINPPYQVGDILYVRETFGKDRFGEYYYRADYPEHDCEPYPIWKPSIHMPREAARIFLKVTNVRVERVPEITEDGARAEGIVEANGYEAVRKFARLWNSIYYARGYGWGTAPWVWVIEFERTEKP